MRVRVFPSAGAVARALAQDVARLLRRAPASVLGLPAGHTPIPFYQALIRLYAAGRVDFRRARSFNLDEFIGLGPSHPSSYHAFMRRELFDHVNFEDGRCDVPRGDAHQIGTECERYERAIGKAGGIDLQILGLGLNGHVGFNEPATALAARTHRASLSLATRRANAAFFDGRVAAVPREAISAGMGTILGARRIVLIATGRAKASAVAAMVNGPVTTRVPASLLQLHADAEVWVDREAARALRAVRGGGLRRLRQSRRARSRGPA